MHIRKPSPIPNSLPLLGHFIVYMMRAVVAFMKSPTTLKIPALSMANTLHDI